MIGPLRGGEKEVTVHSAVTLPVQVRSRSVIGLHAGQKESPPVVIPGGP